MNTRRFVRNSLLLVGIEMLAKTLGVVFFALVARFLGARELGLLAFATAVANFIVIPARFGFETVVQRDVGRNPAGTRAYFQGIGQLKGLISLAVMVIYVAALKIAGRGEVTVMVLVACFTLVYSFMEFVNAFFRANQRPELELAVRSFFSVSNLLLGLMVLYAGWRLAGVVSSQLLSVGLAVILGVGLLRGIAAPVKAQRDQQHPTKYLAAAAPFAGILVALYLSNQTGVLILTPWAGSVEVGYFAAAARLFDALTLIPAAVMGAFLPLMSQPLCPDPGWLRAHPALHLQIPVHPHGAPGGADHYSGPQDHRLALQPSLCALGPGPANPERRPHFQLLELRQRKRAGGAAPGTAPAEAGLDHRRHPRGRQPAVDSPVHLPGGLLGDPGHPGALQRHPVQDSAAALSEPGRSLPAAGPAGPQRCPHERRARFSSGITICCCRFRPACWSMWGPCWPWASSAGESCTGCRAW